MNQRERLLAAAVLGLIALWAGHHLYGRYKASLQSRRTEVQTARSTLAELNLKLAEGRSAARQMEAWQKRSLPENFETALSLYKAWLLAKAKDAGLAVSDIKLSPTTSNSTAYKAVGYQLIATGSLPAVTSMLYEFYRSPQLHQITSLKLTRPPGSQQLQVTLDVEALSLRGAAANDRLPEGDSKRLKLADLAQYLKSLSERDVVTAYTPPRPPGQIRDRQAPAAPPKFDESEQARFSATVSNGKGLQAWIFVKPTGETLHLQAGDPVKVGLLDGQIESVEAHSLVLKSGDKRYRVPLGEYLRKGKELDANGVVKPEPAAPPSKS